MGNIILLRAIETLILALVFFIQSSCQNVHISSMNVQILLDARRVSRMVVVGLR